MSCGDNFRQYKPGNHLHRQRRKGRIMEIAKTVGILLLAGVALAVAVKLATKNPLPIIG